jgi:hypothetical protein
MDSYLSPIINNTFGLAASGQVQPEIISWQYLGLNEVADPFTGSETSLAGSGFSINEPTERADRLKHSSKTNRYETPAKNLTVSTVENTGSSFVRSRKTHSKQDDIKPGQEKTVFQKPVARTIIASEITSGIPILPLNKSVVPTDPERLNGSQNMPPVHLFQPSPVGLQKDGRPGSSKEAKEVIMSHEGIFKHDKSFPEKQIKMVEPELSSPPVFPQLTKKQGDDMRSRDLLPNKQDAPLPDIRTKQETRLVIGKLTVEVVQQEKEKDMPIPPPVTVYHKPAQVSSGRNSGGSMIKVKYGLGQM